MGGVYRKQKVEHHIQQVLDSVVENRQTEDRAVELKSEWPTPDKAYETARQLAGHANAARGEPVVWVIGVHASRKEILGAERQEVKPWYDPLRKHFDGEIIPELIDDLVIPYGDKTVLAMVFDTSHAPYVMKVSRDQGTSVQREVPYRVGTHTVSATREHMLRILVPRMDSPEVEILSAEVVYGEYRHDQASMKVDIYVTIPNGGRALIPAHRCSIKFDMQDCGPRFEVEQPMLLPHVFGDNHAVAKVPQIVVNGGSHMTIVGVAHIGAKQFDGHDLDVIVSLGIPHSEIPAAAKCRLKQTKQGVMVWKGPVE